MHGTQSSRRTRLPSSGPILARSGEDGRSAPYKNRSVSRRRSRGGGQRDTLVADGVSPTHLLDKTAAEEGDRLDRLGGVIVRAPKLDKEQPLDQLDHRVELDLKWA